MGIFDSFKRLFESKTVIQNQKTNDQRSHSETVPANTESSSTLDPVDEFSLGLRLRFAQRAVDLVNDALRKANGSRRLHRRDSYVRLAKMKLDDVKCFYMSEPGLKFTNLEEFERSIAAVEAETEEMRLTQAGQVAEDQTFLTLSLVKQCKSLGIPLETIELEKSKEGWMVDGVAHKRPEPAVFAYLKRQGFDGAYSEGFAPLSLLKCACLDYLISVNTLGDPDDACLRYFGAQCEIHITKSEKIIQHIRSATDESMTRNLNKFLSVIEGSSLYPEGNLNNMLALWRGLGPEQLGRFAETFMLAPSDFCAGWPDLTVAKGNVVRFIEVKTSDKIHASQRDTIRDLLLPAGANVSVIRVKAQKPISKA